MDKILAMLNIIIFGLIFIGGIDVVFIKKSFNLREQVGNGCTVGVFIVFALPILLSLINLF